MKRLIKEKNEACLLRAKGNSIPLIARELGVAKSSVSLWVKDIVLPKVFQDRLKKNSRDGREKGREMIRVKKELEKEELDRETLGQVQSYLKKKDRFSSLVLDKVLKSRKKNFAHSFTCMIIMM